MVDPDTIRKKQAKKLLKLLEQWTRAEIVARFGQFDNLEFADYYIIKIEKADEIRRFLYDTDNLVELGERWGLLRKGIKKRKNKKQNLR